MRALGIEVPADDPDATARVARDFVRRTQADVAENDLCALHRVSTVLPASPLSYSGVIVKIRWCVRVRAFLRRGKEVLGERSFQLGDVPSVRAVVA